MALVGYGVGWILEHIIPYNLIKPVQDKPSFRVTQDDIDYANGKYVASTTDIFSGNNRKAIDMIKDTENKKRLVYVLQMVRSIDIDRFRTDTCNYWVYWAAVSIANLPKVYWENEEYKIDQVWYEPPVSGKVAEHALLRVTIKGENVNQTKFIYFDNGAWGDTSVVFWTDQRATGGIVFSDNIPQTWTYRQDLDKGLDNIASMPGRLAGFGF
jgi:hypothetical protein